MSNYALAVTVSKRESFGTEVSHKSVPINALLAIQAGSSNNLPTNSSTLSRRSPSIPSQERESRQSSLPRTLVAEVFQEEIGHDLISFFRLRQLRFVPEGVRQCFEDDQFLVHTGMQEGAVEDRCPAEQ